jgi:hypothetical protein
MILAYMRDRRLGHAVVPMVTAVGVELRALIAARLRERAFAVSRT